MAIEKALRYVTLAGIFLFPFVAIIVADGVHFPYSLFFPYITGKNFTFRLIVEIISGAWLALALVDETYRPKRSWIFGAFAVFLFVIALADAFGVAPFKSFWSNYERMDGWVTLAHTFALVIVAASILTTEKLWRWFFWISLGVSVYLSIYGFLQIAGISALGEGGQAGLGARIDATFGNPIYLAAYLLFHVCIAALLWSQSWRRRGPDERLAPSIVYGAIILIDTFALLFTGTRGTTIGLAGALIIALVIVAAASHSRIARRNAAVVLGLILLAFAGFWGIRDTTVVHTVGFLDRLATISTSDSTIKARFLNWGMAWRGVEERPLLGWGQENYAIVFDKYYDPRMYAQEPWFDRVHNIIFDWLVAGGFLGLLSCLSIFAATLWVLWRPNPSDVASFSIAERSILTGLLAGYFVHNFFVFDNVTSYILFAFILAYIAFRSSASHPQPILSGSALPRSALPFSAAGSVFVVWALAWSVNAAAFAENRALLDAISPHPQEGITKNLELFKEAILYGTYGTQEVREQLIQGATSLAGAQNVPLNVKQQFFETAAREMSLQAAESPLDARFPLFLGILADAYGDYADAAKFLEKAHELSPQKQAILFEIAFNQEARGDSAGALKTFGDAYNLAPDYAQARILYAAAAIRAGEDPLADQLLAPVISSGEAADARIAAAYLARKRFDKIVLIWDAHVKAQPQDVQGYFTLAAAYYAEGNSAKAIETLARAAAISPEAAARAHALIEQVKNGTAKIEQ